MAEGWTAARVAELRRMIAGKLSFANIAVRLGITRNACIGKASRLKIAVPNKSEAAPPAVRRMVREAKRLRRAKARRSRSRCDEAATAWGQDQCGCAVSLRGALKAAQIPPTVAPGSLNLAIGTLEAHHCRYITNDDLSHATYCGHNAVTGTSWCAFHLERVREVVVVEASPPLVAAATQPSAAHSRESRSPAFFAKTGSPHPRG